MQAPLFASSSLLPSLLRPVLLAFALSGAALAGGGGPPVPAPVHAAHTVDVTIDEEPSSVAAVTIHVGDTLRVHVVESRIDDYRRWFAMSGDVAGLHLTGQDAESQGDHGYLSTIYDVTYTYRASATAPGTYPLLFAYITPPPYDASLTPSVPSLHWLTVTVLN